MLSGNGQGVACGSDADCADARLKTIGDIKAFATTGKLVCAAHGQTGAKICTTSK